MRALQRSYLPVSNAQLREILHAFEKKPPRDGGAALTASTAEIPLRLTVAGHEFVRSPATLRHRPPSKSHAAGPSVRASPAPAHAGIRPRHDPHVRPGDG